MRESFWKTVSSEIYTSSLSCIRILLEYVLCSKGLGKNRNIRERQSYCDTVILPCTKYRDYYTSVNTYIKRSFVIYRSAGLNLCYNINNKEETKMYKLQ
jgi:hypothetical protein